MCEYIKAKSLKFLSLDGLYEALEKGKRNIVKIKKIRIKMTIIFFPFRNFNLNSMQNLRHHFTFFCNLE